MAQKMGWTLEFRVDRVDKLGGVMRRRDYPIGSVTVHRNRRHILLTVQGHLAYYPHYPHITDGVKVHRWYEHLSHVIGHEMVHITRIILEPQTTQMYDNIFQWLNQWVYGHSQSFDDIASDEDSESTISSDDYSDS